MAIDRGVVTSWCAALLLAACRDVPLAESGESNASDGRTPMRAVPSAEVTAQRPVVDRADRPLDWRPAPSADEGPSRRPRGTTRGEDPLRILPRGVEPTPLREIDVDVSRSDELRAQVSFRVCFLAESQFTDSLGGGPNGEDYYRSAATTARELRGNLVEIYFDGVFQERRWLGDDLDADDPGKGCFATYRGSMGTYSFRVVPLGYVNSNFVAVRDEATLDYDAPTVHLDVATGGTQTITLTDISDQLNVYAAASYAIWRHGGGGNGVFYDVRTRTTHDLGSHYDDESRIVHVHANHLQKKFVIAHELGHALLDAITNKGGGDMKHASDACKASKGDHSMASLEYASAAFNEGFAHFYSASVFNRENETDCRIRYYKDEFGDGKEDVVDCESANGKYVNRFAETCVDDGDPDGYGTELDWMRALWDVYTDRGGIEFDSVLDWIGTADRWSKTNTYSKLDSAANAVGGRLDTNWDAAKTDHGVDH